MAFVGLNPGGNRRTKDHAEFAMGHGSAYAAENWGASPGRSKLQRQVLALFEKIGERPEAAPQGHKTYGSQYIVVQAMPRPRGNKPFTLCANC